MIYASIILVVIATIFFYIHKSKKFVFTGVDKAFDLINMGAGVYLMSKYKEEYEGEVPVKLAGAVTNKLFGHKQTNELGIKFLENNKALVEQKFLELKNEKNLCYYVSIAAHLKANVAANRKKLTADILEWIFELTETGILIPLENINMPKSNAEFLEVANEFLSLVKKTKEKQT
ncbi:MAG: hypothetical protein ABI185_00340 [Ginsengibacter sp.]